MPKGGEALSGFVPVEPHRSRQTHPVKEARSTLDRAFDHFAAELWIPRRV